MPDDWRVELDIEGHGGPRRLVDAARERTVAREARKRFGAPVLVTLDKDKLFAYAGTRDQAEEAARELAELAAGHGLTAHASIARWHPVSERWEPPDVPLPSTPEEQAAERARLQDAEDAESEAWGHPEWEVRVELDDREATAALAERMEAEGRGVLRRAKYVLIGAPDEDAANALAERLRGELPAQAKVVAEGSEAYAWAELHRYSWLGGFGQ